MAAEYRPLYMQVMEDIKARIEGGVYPLAQALPSESKFAREFGVSISTIRQAISVLVAEEILIKKQGKGTYIQEKKQTIKFFSWLPETPKGKILLQKMIGMVESKFSDIRVEVIPTTYLTAKKDLELLIAEGNAPDLAQIVSHWTSSFATTGALVKLDAIIPEKTLALRSSKDLQSGKIGDSIYSLSWGECPLVLLANMDVLRKHGIEDINEKISIDEWSILAAVINKESAEDSYVYGLPYQDGEADFLRVYSFLRAFGGTLVNNDGEFVFDSKENIDALLWLQGFSKSYRVLFSDVISIREKFVDGKIAFMHDGPWANLWLNEMANGDIEGKFKAILNPVVCNADEVGEAVSKSWKYNHALAIPSQCKVVSYALRVLEALTIDPDISNYYYAESGHLPVVEGQNVKDLSDTEFYKVFFAQLAGAENIQADNPLFGKALDFCIDAVHNIFIEEKSVKDELAEKQRYLNILYKD